MPTNPRDDDSIPDEEIEVPDAEAATDDDAEEDTEDDAVEETVVVKTRKRPAADSASKAASSESADTGGSPKQITLSVRALVLGLVGLLVGAGLLFGIVDNLRVRNQLGDLRDRQANEAKAEEIAGDYAVKAATLDYNDLTPWAANLKKGVSPQLAKQFDVAVPAMTQILTPVRMKTTANLVSSTTTDVSGDVYKVTAVVDVNTTSLQTPNGASALAAYVLTLNKADNWMITAVGDQATPGGTPRLPGMPNQPQQQQQQQAPPTQPAPPGG
ncbi:hypothetical protein GOARA_088_00530 [Gordonia araii NBRC 100433]|uniref:Mce-associated membrane protein n=1 Tax=Gordonia araii NBRC 100433 TaxID=1073574 RepID=G7H7G4_9ACTN|nr:hypothetical protein [Gordonia araii]NNG98472.1 hypothetical protein [Gordonia araii NBRC 100433]GAB11789.1 hypothetical protein GOARA_088_00530 [Gordonia araii NBRC 100433]